MGRGSLEMGKMGPRGEIRIVYHADGNPINHIPLHPKEEDHYKYVDNLAEGAVDVLSLCSFAAGKTLWQSDHATDVCSKHSPDHPSRIKLESLWAQGVEPIAAYAKRCHEKGLKFLAKFRMNDRHHQGHLSGHFNMHMGKFLEDHQEWWIKSIPGGLDFTHQGVRDWYLTLAREVVSRFDIDGITFHYMRFPYVFEPDESREKQPILTEFMRQVRKMLDEEGQKKGRKMLFCVVVPVTLEEGHNLGCDVPAWIEEELVDIVCPCDWASTIVNAPYHEFAELTRKKNVYLMPSIHAHISRQLCRRNLMSLPSYRATACNFYGAGADGVSAFNYMYHWSFMEGIGYPGSPEQYPGALYYFRELRSVEKVKKGDRHYLWWPDENRQIAFPGLADRSRIMRFTRDIPPTHPGRWTIRCAEEFDAAEDALMLLNVVNFLPGDEMKLTINGSVIPQESISFTFHENGRNEIQKGMRLPPYTSITCKPTSPPFVFGENTIEIEMTKSAPGSYECSLYTRNLSVPEIEIGISASGRPVLEVMSEIEERYAPPVKSLAGYHPEAQKAHVDARYGGTTKQPIGDRTFIKGTELVSRGAQAFVLDKEAIIERVDICVSSTPDVREPLRLSVRGDKNGLPADKPVDAGAIASFDPLETPEGLSSLALNGYYRLTFTKPLILAAGSYWLVFEMDPSEQPQQSQVSMPTDSQPLPSSCYRILLASTAHKEYPRGRYLAWTDEGWEEVKQLGQELAAFFGVFEKTGKG